jgi:hypothetical protein
VQLLSIRGKALKFDGFNERRNIMVLELVKQGYTAEQIEAKLAQTTAGMGD